jgi:hypothetical protein
LNYNRALSCPEWSHVIKQLSMLVALVLLLSACAPAATPTAVPPTLQPRPAAPTSRAPIATAVPPTATTAPVSTVAPVRTLYPAPTNPIKATLVATEVSPLGFVHEYYVDAWFDNPNPAMGSNVTLSVSLLHNGLWGGGATVWFYWVQGGEPRSFMSIVIYQRGILTIPVTGFEPGVYVPITYTFHSDDKLFTGYTGFTPQ